MRKSVFALMVVMVLCIAASSFALDLNPPAWRGDPGSTWAQWEFGTDSTTPAPDLGENPYGCPSILVTPVISGNWIPDLGSYTGIWPLSGTIEVGIPNNPIENDSKLIQIQLTWASECYEAVPTTFPGVGVTAIKVDGTAVCENDISLIEEYSENLGPTGVSGIGEFWYHTTYVFEIFPNPKMENIMISGSILVDELVIDTICIPEPATVALLSIGGLLVIKRRKHS